MTVAGPWRAAAAGLLLIVVLGGCNRSGEPAGPSDPTGLTLGTTVGSTTGDTCDDPPGDLTDDGDAPVTGPAGIDIVRASAELTDGVFDVRFDMAGPIDQAPDAELLVGHGDLASHPATSWELRLDRQQEAWRARLITLPPVGAQKEEVLAAPVTVTETTVAISVTEDVLPPFTSVLWYFGATAGVSADRRVVDDCIPWAQEPDSNGTSGSLPDQPPVTTATAALAGRVGDTLTDPDGTAVTVHVVEAPVVVPENSDLTPFPGSQFVLVEATVCAGSASASVGDERFVLGYGDGRSASPWPGPEIVHGDRFPVDVTLRPNDCQRGWIQYEIDAQSHPSSVSYDLGGSGIGPLLVFET